MLPHRFSNKRNHITCNKPVSIVKDLKLLIDTGSEVNIIKIDCLNRGLEVNVNENIYIKGISDKIIQTIGKVTIPLIIDDNELEKKFHIVRRDFPILNHGILGHKFLSENKIIIDVANKTSIIKTDNEKYDDKICFTLKPRSETIVSIPIADPSVENKNIIIHKQKIMDNVYCGNVLNKVEYGKIIVSILKISEVPQAVVSKNLNKIKYNSECE